MKIAKHVEEVIICDSCKKEIRAFHWNKISNRNEDFCSVICATKFRDILFKIIEHEKYPREIGNTD